MDSEGDGVCKLLDWNTFHFKHAWGTQCKLITEPKMLTGEIKARVDNRESYFST